MATKKPCSDWPFYRCGTSRQESTSFTGRAAVLSGESTYSCKCLKADKDIFPWACRNSPKPKQCFKDKLATCHQSNWYVQKQVKKRCMGTLGFCTKSTRRSKCLQEGDRGGKRHCSAERERGAELPGASVCGAGGRDPTAPGPQARVCMEHRSRMVPLALF